MTRLDVRALPKHMQQQLPKEMLETKQKFNNTPTEYNGVIYHSKAEADYAADLDWMIKGGLIIEWDRQIVVPLIVNGVHICKYIIDFKIVENDETVRLVELKGYQSEAWKLKNKLFQATFLKEHPEIGYEIIKLVK